jgi:hypothetical protein
MSDLAKWATAKRKLKEAERRGEEKGLEGYRAARFREEEQRQRADKAEGERDLAVAHDRQPYPTADAYEKVCAALEAMRADRDRLERVFNKAAFLVFWSGDETRLQENLAALRKALVASNGEPIDCPTCGSPFHTAKAGPCDDPWHSPPTHQPKKPTTRDYERMGKETLDELEER